MPGEVERNLRQVRKREWEKGRRKGGQKEGKDGEGSLIRWLVQPQYGITGPEIGRGNPKHFWPPNMSWLLAYPCKGLAVPTEVILLMPFLALGEWLVWNLENSNLKDFYLNSCA